MPVPIQALTVGDVGDRAERSGRKLISFAQNLNPALRFALAQVLGEHETTPELVEKQKQRFHPLTSLLDESDGSDGPSKSAGSASGLATFSPDEEAEFKNGFGRSLVPARVSIFPWKMRKFLRK